MRQRHRGLTIERWRRLARRVWRATAALSVVWATGCQEPALKGIAIDPPRVAPPLDVRRADGSRFTLERERGRAVLLFFGYTHCPDICPSTLADWARVRRQPGLDTSRVRFVFVSVDPQRDSPAIAQAYAAQFDATFIGLSPDTLDLPAIQYGFGITSSREPGGSATEYLVSHAAQSFLVSPDGTLAAMYSFGASVADVTSDLKALLK